MSLGKEATRDAIARMPVFAGLSDAAISALAGIASVQRYDAQSYLFNAGDRLTHVYALISGRLRAMFENSDGSSLILGDVSSHGEGAAEGWIGYMSFGRQTAEFNLLTLEPSLVLHLPVTDFRRIADANPSIWNRLIDRSDDKIGDMVRLLKQHTRYTLETRVAISLLRLLGLYGERKGSEVRLGEKVTQAELADYSGGSRQNINRILKGWEQAGIVQLHGRDLSVNDVERLWAMIPEAIR